MLRHSELSIQSLHTNLQPFKNIIPTRYSYPDEFYIEKITKSISIIQSDILLHINLPHPSYKNFHYNNHSALSNFHYSSNNQPKQLNSHNNHDFQALNIQAYL